MARTTVKVYYFCINESVYFKLSPVVYCSMVREFHRGSESGGFDFMFAKSFFFKQRNVYLS